VAALQPDKGEASGQLMGKFAAPNDAMAGRLPPRPRRTNIFFHPCGQVPGKPMPLMFLRRKPKFMADPRSSNLAEKAMGTPLSEAAWHNKAQLCHPDPPRIMS